MEKSKLKKLLIILGAALLLIVIVVANLKKSGGNKIKVQTDKATRGSITAAVSGSAKIQPEIQVKISAKVSGQIIRLGVKEGDFVKQGDFLVQLDQEYYQAAVEQNKSNLQFAEAGYTKARNEYERAKALFADNLSSQAELDIAKSSFDQAEAQVAQSRAMLVQAEDNLAKTLIYAPMNGTVSQLNKKVGEMAMGSQFTLDVIMIVADLNKMMAETEIDENDVVEVSIGDTAGITIDAFPEKTFSGVVKEIANTGTSTGLGTQEEVTNFLVKVSMLQPPSGLRPSMSATVDIRTDTRINVLKVPIQCLTVRSPQKEEGKEGAEPAPIEGEDLDDKTIRVVFVIRDGVAHQIEVQTGLSSDTEWEILSGINEGDEVVSGTYRVLSKQLKDGDLVKIDNTTKKYGREEE